MLVKLDTDDCVEVIKWFCWAETGWIGRNYFESLSIGLSVVVLDYTCFSGIGSYSIRVACN